MKKSLNVLFLFIFVINSIQSIDGYEIGKHLKATQAGENRVFVGRDEVKFIHVENQKKQNRHLRRQLEDSNWRNNWQNWNNGGDDDQWWKKYANNNNNNQGDGEGGDGGNGYGVQGRFYELFNTPPSEWTANQWGFFSAMMTALFFCTCCCCMACNPFRRGSCC